MQRRSLRRAEPVDHGKGPGLDPDGVDDQRVAFVMADGIAKIAWDDIGRMLRIHAHMPDLMIDLINHGDVIRPLENLQPVGRENEGYSIRPALIARIVETVMGYRLFAELLHRRRGFGL